MFLYSFQVTVAILILGSKSLPADKPRSCDERATHPNLKQDYLNWLEANCSLLTNPAYQQIPHIFNGIDIEPAFQNYTSTSYRGYLQGNHSCTNSIDTSSDLISERSTCPWHLLLNEDENRYPKSLITVKCTCTKCLDFNRENQPQKKTHRNKNKKKKGGRKSNKRTIKRQTAGVPKCQEIDYMHKVLRKVCIKNTFQYVPTYERISIGCTCAKSTG